MIPSFTTIFQDPSSMDLQLPREVRPVWLEGVMTAQFELDTLPLLFSPDGQYIEYYEALIRKNSHINGPLSEVKKLNDEARTRREEGLWQECIQLLWKCLEMRKVLFESRDFQVTGAQKHYIMTLVNFATFFLKEGGSGHSAADEAMYYRSFGIFKQAEDATNTIEDRVDRTFLKAVVANNFATYYARRKKQKAAAQKISTAVKAFRAFSQEVEKQQEGAEATRSDKTACTNANPSKKSKKLAYETDSDDDDEPVTVTRPSAADDEAMTPSKLKIKIEHLYFALQNGSGDIWSNRFAEGLERLLSVAPSAEQIAKAVLVEEEVTDDEGDHPVESDEQSRRSPSGSSSGRASSAPTSRSHSRSSSASPKKSPKPKTKKSAKKKSPSPRKSPQKQSQQPSSIKKKKMLLVRRSPKIGTETGAPGHCIRVLGSADLPIDIATILSLYHNIAVAYVGVRNYKAALVWNVKCMDFASHYASAKSPKDEKPEEGGAHVTAGGLSIHTALIQRMRKCREYLEQMNFMTTVSSRAVAKLKAATQPASKRPTSATMQATASTSPQRRNSAADRAKEREEVKTLKVAETALSHPRSSEAAAAYLPHHSRRFKEPTMAEKLQTYLVGMSFRDLVQNYEVDDGGKLSKLQQNERKTRRQLAREREEKEQQELRERRERLNLRRAKEAQKTQQKHEAAVAAHTPRSTNTPRRTSPHPRGTPRNQNEEAPLTSNASPSASTQPTPRGKENTNISASRTLQTSPREVEKDASPVSSPTAASSSSARSPVETPRATTGAANGVGAMEEVSQTSEQTPPPKEKPNTAEEDITDVPKAEPQPVPGDHLADPHGVSKEERVDAPTNATPRDTNNDTVGSEFSPLSTARDTMKASNEKPETDNKSNKDESYDDEKFSKSSSSASSRHSSPSKSSRAASTPQSSPRAPAAASSKKDENAYAEDEFEDTQDESMIKQAQSPVAAKNASEVGNQPSLSHEKDSNSQVSGVPDTTVSTPQPLEPADVASAVPPEADPYGDDDFEESPVSKPGANKGEELPAKETDVSDRSDPAVSPSAATEDPYGDDFEDTPTPKKPVHDEAKQAGVQQVSSELNAVSNPPPPEADPYGDDDFEQSPVSKNKDAAIKPAAKEGNDDYDDEDFEDEL